MQTLHATVEHHRFSPVEHSKPSGHIQSGTKESIPEGECVKLYGKLTDETQIDISDKRAALGDECTHSCRASGATHINLDDDDDESAVLRYLEEMLMAERNPSISGARATTVQAFEYRVEAGEVLQS
jgi:hypothetical protein